MGMAASQARYLALIARKSNCEYEGQQINQARLALSNQSANLFNQMLGLSVPVPPSTTDFTKKQYSFSDGINDMAIEEWHQLAEPDSEGYNYVVDYYYNADVYTGAQKKMNDPQVQFSLPSNSDVANTQQIQQALKAIEEAQKAYDEANLNYSTLLTNSKNLNLYKDSRLGQSIKSCIKNDNGTYTVDYNKIEIIDGQTYFVYKGSDNRTYYSQNGKDYKVKNDDGNYVDADIILLTQNNKYLHNLGDTQQIEYNGEFYTIGKFANNDTTYYAKGDSYYTMNAQGVLIEEQIGAQELKFNPNKYLDSGETTVKIGDINYTVYISDNKWYYKNDDIYYTLESNGLEPVRDGYVTTMDVQTINEETYTLYNSTGASDTLKNAIEVLKAADTTLSDSDFYYYGSEENGYTIALLSDLKAAAGNNSSVLPVFHTQGTPGGSGTWQSIEDVQSQLDIAKRTVEMAHFALETAKGAYELMNVPKYIGNNELIPLTELTSSQQAEIRQIITDMEDQEVKTNFTKYFNPDTNEYNGGIYMFKLNGVTYYTTYDDLLESYRNGTGINHIDDQPKLAYYNASYQKKKIEKQDKAILETDSTGRFVSIRLNDNTITYKLNVETVTDEVAYKDAMNRYYYENAQYDKMVQDINAKTSIIHVEDRTLELRLKQLDTEHNALTNEIEAVQKVIKENVEKSFKTFGG